MGIFNFIKKPTDDFEACLYRVFEILSRGDKRVMSEIEECLRDTEVYYAYHQQQFEDRNLIYSPKAKKWIQLMAAVDALEASKYAVELDYKEIAEEFRAALETVLDANKIEFSLNNMEFDPQKNIPDWVAQFNEYAGQSGITVYWIDTDSDSFVLGAADIADYAEAADIAGNIGICISSNPK